MIEYKGKIYSKEPLSDYKMRFKVEFEVRNLEEKENYRTSMDIYTTAETQKELNDFIEAKRKEKVVQFKIVHSATKHQDDLSGKLIEEFFKELEDGDNNN